MTTKDLIELIEKYDLDLTALKELANEHRPYLGADSLAFVAAIDSFVKESETLKCTA